MAEPPRSITDGSLIPARPTLAARAEGQCSPRSTSAHGRLERLVEIQHFAVDLRGVGLGILLQEKRRDLALVGGHREEGLVGKQFDAARGIEHVGDVDLLAFGFHVGLGAEHAGGAAERLVDAAVYPAVGWIARDETRYTTEIVLV